MTLRIFCLLITGLPLVANAQVSMEDFLRGALQEPSVQTAIQQRDFLSTKPFRLAPIQKMEFRTESNQLDPERQDYALRINPANPWEMKRNNEYFDSYKDLLALERNRQLEEALVLRYEIIIDWVYYDELKIIREEDKVITEKLLSILEGQRFSGYFDGDRYVDQKLDQVEKIIELEEARFEMDNQTKKAEALFKEAKSSPLAWSYKSVIGLDKLEAVVDSLLLQKSDGGEVAYREKEIEVASREWRLEKNNINVGYLQAQYQEYRTEQGRKPWNLSLGVTIPVFNPNKGDMAKRKMDVIEAEGELLTAKNEMQAGRERLSEKIKNQLKRYRDLTTMMEDLKTGTLASVLQQLNDRNPAAVVRMQSKIIKLKLMAVQLKQEIYISYLEFLNYSDVLPQEPLVNYLSPNLQPIVK